MPDGLLRAGGAAVSRSWHLGCSLAASRQAGTSASARRPTYPHPVVTLATIRLWRRRNWVLGWIRRSRSWPVSGPLIGACRWATTSRSWLWMMSAGCGPRRWTPLSGSSLNIRRCSTRPSTVQGGTARPPDDLAHRCALDSPGRRTRRCRRPCPRGLRGAGRRVRPPSGRATGPGGLRRAVRPSGRSRTHTGTMPLAGTLQPSRCRSHRCDVPRGLRDHRKTLTHQRRSTTGPTARPSVHGQPYRPPATLLAYHDIVPKPPRSGGPHGGRPGGLVSARAEVNRRCPRSGRPPSGALRERNEPSSTHTPLSRPPYSRHERR
ncbi:hypothetical protein SUDANB99_06014 (plasmid) [Streptomyces sp. enrichment culture]